MNCCCPWPLKTLICTVALKLSAPCTWVRPPVFNALERRFAMDNMRADGVAVIMFSLQLQANPIPIASHAEVKLRFRCRLVRYEGPHPHRQGAKPIIRWGIEMRSEIWGRKLKPNAGHFGLRGQAGEWLQAGLLQAHHIITRPMAAPEERHLDEAPPALQELEVHVWPGEYPSVEALTHSDLAAAIALPALPKAQRPELTFGMHQSDVNQHINVHEGLRALENASTTLLHQAGQPIETWRTHEIGMLFRAPFFVGQRAVVRVDGRVAPSTQQAVCTGGLWRLENDNTPAKSPAIYGRLQGGFLRQHP